MSKSIDTEVRQLKLMTPILGERSSTDEREPKGGMRTSTSVQGGTTV